MDTNWLMQFPEHSRNIQYSHLHCVHVLWMQILKEPMEEVAALEVIQGVLASQTLHAEKAELARSFPRCLAPRSVPLDLEGIDKRQ